MERYQTRPLDYIREQLKVKLWSAQEEIVRLLMEPPRKVMVKSCHKVGKSFLSACLVSWHYDCFPHSLTITTAPDKVAVKDQLWRELRIIRAAAGLGGFRGQMVPELWSAHDHWAKGITAEYPESFHGKHQQHALFVIDEGVRVPAWVYDVIRSMFKPSADHYWLVIGNPTDTASQMYAEEYEVDGQGNPAWRLVSLAAPDHPNIQAALRGELDLPYPSAVDLPQFENWLSAWSEPIPADEADRTDLEWPPGSGIFYRPGPQMEARALGRWPSAATFGLWSDSLWTAAQKRIDIMPLVLPEIGCDVARFGDDFTELHVRCGPCSLHHERHNGWPTDRTAGRLKELARQWIEWHNRRLQKAAQPRVAEEIPIKVDDGGVGGGVTDQRGGYLFVPILAQNAAVEPDKYPDKRSELWFAVSERARRGRLDLSRLPRDILRRLRQQAMAPLWKQDAQGRRQVESKKDTKKRLPIGSPDGMDAMNLAFYEGYSSAAAQSVDVPRIDHLTPRTNSAARERHLFGRR